MFIGRERELAVLNKLYESDKFQFEFDDFLAIYYPL